MKSVCRILLALVGLSFGLFAVDSVDAADSRSNTTMQVAPVIEELTLKPTEQVDKTISVTNQGDQETKVRVYVAPYSFSTEKNSSDFESQTEYTQVYHWIKIAASDDSFKDEAEFVIGAHKTVNIGYRVKVPESAPGGSQHACIFVETVPDVAASSGSIITVSRAAVKVFADVAGETTKDAEVMWLDTSTFVVDGKVTATTAVKNIGNVDIKPTLTLKVNTLNGETVFNSTNVAMIFPENNDELKVEWLETPAFGIYNLIASTNILGKNMMVDKVIVIMPSWFIVLSLIVIVAVVAVVVRRHKINKIKRRRAGY